jgi:hypothetical protein
MVHASHEHATLEEEVQHLKAASPEKLNARVDDLEKQTVKLRETVTANRRVFVPVVGLSFLLGVFCGGALPYFRRRKHQEPPQ